MFKRSDSVKSVSFGAVESRCLERDANPERKNCYGRRCQPDSCDTEKSQTVVLARRRRCTSKDCTLASNAFLVEKKGPQGTWLRPLRHQCAEEPHVFVLGLAFGIRLRQGGGTGIASAPVVGSERSCRYEAFADYRLPGWCYSGI